MVREMLAETKAQEEKGVPVFHLGPNVVETVECHVPHAMAYVLNRYGELVNVIDPNCPFSFIPGGMIVTEMPTLVMIAEPIRV